MTVTSPPGSPPATKIERLLIWLPANQFIDFQTVGRELKGKLALNGIASEVGMSQPLELDRADAQRGIIRRLQPTHRLEFDVVRSMVTGNAGLLMDGRRASVTLRGALYQIGNKTPIRVFIFSVKEAATAKLIGDAFVGDVIEKLHSEGFI